jgi:hypothetical protein
MRKGCGFIRDLKMPKGIATRFFEHLEAIGREVKIDITRDGHKLHGSIYDLAKSFKK